MKAPEDAGKYQIDNDGTVQGQVVGDHNITHQHFYATQDKTTSSTKPERHRNIPATHSLSSNRERLLKRVRATWIEGLLEQSLHRAVWIDLHLQEQPDALENPWRLEVQELNHAPHLLPVGTSIVEVYDEADGELLILGEPGAGKTTLLLRLVQALLDRAKANERLPMPVVLNLSSWAKLRQPLTAWLTAELWVKYQVPQQIAAHWIAANQILPLLDGLDEVHAEARTACVQAITAYHARSSSQVETPLVVCCRSQEYQDLSLRLPLSHAVGILPLTEEQIDTYLSSTQVQLEELRRVLRNDAELKKLACRPLMLSIFALTYQGPTAAELAPKSTEEQTQHAIFESYVKRMLSRRRNSPRFPRQQTIRRLSWLARQMKHHHQSTFFVEELSPSWLQQTGSFNLISSLTNGLLLALFFGLLGMRLLEPYNELLSGLFLGLSLGFLFGLFLRPIFELLYTSFVLSVLLLGGEQGDLFFSELVSSKLGEVRLPLPGHVIFGRLLGMLLFGLLGMLGGMLSSIFLTRLLGSVLLDVLLGILGVFLGALLGVLIGRLLGKLLGMLAQVLFSLMVGGGLFLNLFVLVPLFKLLFGRLGNWLLVEEISTRWLVKQASTLLGGLFVGLISGSLGGLFVGLISGLLFMLILSGLIFLRYYVLRLLLWQSGYTPLRYGHFLNYAVDCLLLNKVGEGYIFMHPLLLEYFATLDESTSSETVFPKDGT